MIRRLLIIFYATAFIVAGCSCESPRINEHSAANKRILQLLDDEIDNRQNYIDIRQHTIDSLRKVIARHSDDTRTLGTLASVYTSFNNDSALAVYDRAYNIAKTNGLDSTAMRFRINRASLLPLAGFINEAINEYTSLNADSMSVDDRINYYTNGRQMYSFISAYYHRFPEARKHYLALSLDAQRRLLELLPHESIDYQLNKAEYCYLTKDYALSEAMLHNLIAELDPDDNRYARATHILADINHVRNDNDGVTRYLALSAISDIRNATREVTSLQELGQKMFEQDDIVRAHDYLYTALRNAVECNAETRMIQVAEAMPLIETVHQKELSSSRHRLYLVIALMALSLVLLIIVLAVLRIKMRQMRQLQMHYLQANATKEVYISQFLNLCSIYMNKLKQFCNIANRKISTGKVDDLYQLTKSGKFIENQSKEFYEIFDNAFIHIYPGFVESVNSLLRPDAQITLGQGEHLNTDLRILAFMRLGISDTARIAQILNYSVNTIYAYRNRLKARAINRETFETDIQRC